MPDWEKLEGNDENLPVTHHSEYVPPLIRTEPFILTRRTTLQRIPCHRSAAAVRYKGVSGQSRTRHGSIARDRAGDLAAVRVGRSDACDNGARGGCAQGDEERDPSCRAECASPHAHRRCTRCAEC
jgi:hypothetical protein